MCKNCQTVRRNALPLQEFAFVAKTSNSLKKAQADKTISLNEEAAAQRKKTS